MHMYDWLALVVGTKTAYNNPSQTQDWSLRWQTQVTECQKVRWGCRPGRSLTPFIRTLRKGRHCLNLSLSPFLYSYLRFWQMMAKVILDILDGIPWIIRQKTASSKFPAQTVRSPKRESLLTQNINPDRCYGRKNSVMIHWFQAFDTRETWKRGFPVNGQHFPTTLYRKFTRLGAQQGFLRDRKVAMTIRRIVSN